MMEGFLPAELAKEAIMEVLIHLKKGLGSS